MDFWDIKMGVPDKLGDEGFVEVLCKVRTPDGFCNHLVLRFDEEGFWWIYIPRLGDSFNGGWVGIGDIEVLEWSYIDD